MASALDLKLFFMHQTTFKNLCLKKRVHLATQVFINTVACMWNGNSRETRDRELKPL